MTTSPDGYVLGVDLGTTYTAAAIGRPGGAVDIVSLGTRAPTIPSQVLLRPDGTMLVGEPAERRGTLEPARLAREFKRRLGDPTPLLLGGTPYSPEALTGHLLASVVGSATAQEGAPPALVVLTHPANFGPYKQDLLREAVRVAGLNDAMFVSEPYAAAVSYVERERLETGEVVIVYDLGGGTFDVAVLRKTEDGFEQLGRAGGLERLGGIDFDLAVFGHVDAALGRALRQADGDPATEAAVLRVRDDCRGAKEALSSDTECTIPIALPNLAAQVRLTRSEFEAMIRPRVEESFAVLEHTVTEAGITMEDVARILLVGGSSRIPLVAEIAHEMTGRTVAVDAHPKHAVAAGAAVVGVEQLAGGTPQANDEPGPESAMTLAERVETHAALRRRRGRTRLLVGVVLLAMLVGGALAASLRGSGHEVRIKEAASRRADRVAASTTTTSTTSTSGPSTTPTAARSVTEDEPPGARVLTERSTSTTNAQRAVPVPRGPSAAPTVEAVAPTTSTSTTTAPRPAVPEIAFASARDGNSEIYAVGIDGSHLRNLTTNPSQDMTPAWSPDGRRIAFSSDRSGVQQLYVMNADGSNVTRLTSGPGDFGPAWSPDGRRIAFNSDRDGDFDIYTINVDGTGLRQITNDPAIDASAAWSPDGQLLAWGSSRNHPFEIFVADADDGSGARRVGEGGDAAWTPDGRRVLASAPDAGGDGEIFAMNVDGSGRVQLTNNSSNDVDPEMSADSATIVFSSTRDGGEFEIYTSNADGSSPHRLTTSPANDSRPTWR